MPGRSAIHDWDSVFFHSNPASNSFRGSVSYAPADGEQNTEVLLGRNSSEADKDAGAPMPSARLVLAPPDDQISTVNARSL